LPPLCTWTGTKGGTCRTPACWSVVIPTSINHSPGCLTKNYMGIWVHVSGFLPNTCSRKRTGHFAIPTVRKILSTPSQ